MNPWWQWNTDPSLIALVLIAAALYRLAIGPWRQRLAPQAPFPLRESLFFDGALVLFYLAVGSPLDELADHYYFVAHMLQHCILIFGVPLLLYYGLPVWLFKPIFKDPMALGLWRVITNPIIALVTFNVLFGIWHIPWAYEWALRDQQVHDLEHITFLMGAMIMWWPVLSRCEEAPRLKPGPMMLYLFFLSVSQIPLFALLVFSSNVLYPTYLASPRLLAGVTPLEDQVMGGIVMKLLGEIAFVAFLFRAFMDWYHEENRA